MGLDHRVVVTGILLLIAASGVHAEPTTRPQAQPATTRAATQPVAPLAAEVHRAVEQAQKVIRTEKPNAKPARNSLEQRERDEDRPADSAIKPIAEGLIGRKGTIAVRVIDVYRNDANTLFTSAPAIVTQRRAEFPFLVQAECDNPTATYLTDRQKRDQDRGSSQYARHVRETAERARPTHKVWILCADDAIVRNWTKGSRHALRGEVLDASLEPVPNDYIRAHLAIKLEADQAAAPTTQP